MSTCWRRSSRPIENVNTLADAHGVQAIPDSGASHMATTQGTAAEAAAITTARASEPRCREAYRVIITPRKNAPSSTPPCDTTSATGTSTRAANTSAGMRGRKPRETKAANAGRSSASSGAEPGSPSWATAMIAAALTTRNGTSWRAVGAVGRARSPRNHLHQATREATDEAVHGHPPPGDPPSTRGRESGAVDRRTCGSLRSLGRPHPSTST